MPALANQDYLCNGLPIKWDEISDKVDEKYNELIVDPWHYDRSGGDQFGEVVFSKHYTNDSPSLLLTVKFTKDKTVTKVTAIIHDVHYECRPEERYERASRG